MPLLLPQIHSPEDIKTLSIEQLKDLAQEIRDCIIQTIAVNGGHLASNLGVVELSIALHKVFDSPQDKILWDVSHQSYAHKLLTGRYKQFHTLRQQHGLSGFSNPLESEHDTMHCGHTGAAFSFALGLAKKQGQQPGFIIPIIGDAALTCGMSLEGLNNCSKDLKNFILILNDNRMAISQNTGAISRLLRRLFNTPFTTKLQQNMESFLYKIPLMGPSLSRKAKKIFEAIKNLCSPSAIFETFGLSYIGPIDGHDIQKVIDTLTQLKKCPFPAVLHVHTEKGKGMKEATKNPTQWHGVNPFNLETKTFHQSTPSFPTIFGNHLLTLAQKNPHFCVVTPATGTGSGLDAFMQKYPDRSFDVGIAESHALTFSGGLAHNQKRQVIACIYSTFLQRAFDNLFHDICLQNSSVLIGVDRAGLSANDGVTHHGIYDISFLNAMPNLIVAQPRNGKLLKELMNFAFTWKKPTAIRYPKNATTDQQPLEIREIGKGEIVHQGQNVLLIALGHMVDTAFAVKDLLEEADIYPTILDPIFIKPLDVALLSSLLQTHKIVITIEEHAVNSGFGSIFNNFCLSQNIPDIQVMNFGIPDNFVHHGNYADLIEELQLAPQQIADKILSHPGVTNLCKETCSSSYI